MNLFQNKSLVLLSILFVLFKVGSMHAQDLVINEVMSDNEVTLEDGLGDYSDWIELYNPGPESLNLGNYFLSDQSINFKKWRMPDYELLPGDYQVVFASGKDTSYLPQFWNTIITWGDEWKYFPGTSEPASNWNNLSFSDDSWSDGKSGIGYGDDDDSTIIEPTISLYCRKTFTIDTDPAKILGAILDIDIDDGFVAYLNGIEIARNNVSGLPPPYDRLADTGIEPEIVYGGSPKRFVMLTSRLGVFNYGENLLAIQVHNSSATSSDMTCIPFLSIESKDKPADFHNEPMLELNAQAPLLHTNFMISSSGEYVFLADAEGNWIDYADTIALGYDQSLGRVTDGGSEWTIFDKATPGASNSLGNSLYFSHERGFYKDPFYLTISSTRNSSIYYTLDGSVPNQESRLYNNSIHIANRNEDPNYYSLVPTTQDPPLNVLKAWEPPLGIIAKATILKCRSYTDGVPTSPVYTSTFFVDPQGEDRYSLPVFSLVMDSLGLFDYDSGIYVPGVKADTTNNRTGNFYEHGMEWEKPVHIEYFETDGSTAFSQDGGIRIHGQYSRRAAQKSLRLHAREEYGKRYFEYPLLPKSDLVKYKRFILRTSMMTYRSRFGDALIADLYRDLDYEIQDYQPVVVFLNGEYWGVHMMRDYVDEYFLNSHYPEVSRDSLDLVRKKAEVMVGSNDRYQELYNFIADNDLKDSASYAYVNSKLDVNNFVDYCVTEMYMANRDWPGNNYTYWCPQSDTGKWRWILNDLDAAWRFPEDNMFEHMLDSVNKKWPNPTWATLTFRKLIKNKAFRNKFLCRSVELMHDEFHPDSIIEYTKQYKQLFIPEMDEHIMRWNYPPSKEEWMNYYDTIIPTFALTRPEIYMEHMSNAFNITEEEIMEMCDCCEPDTSTAVIETKLKDISIYPNPSRGLFTLELPDAAVHPGDLTIYNMTGQIIYNRVLEPGEYKYRIELSGEQAGVYIVRYINGSSVYSSKFVISYSLTRAIL